ncbi:MAG: TrkH family potassium uptake protein [Aminipila sp.]
MSFNYRIIFKIVNIVTIIIGVAMLFPMITAAIYDEWKEVVIFATLSILMIAIPTIILSFLRAVPSHLRIREGYLIVTLCWMTASILGALPYLLSGQTTSVIDAFFESVSAFTTTGSTLFDMDLMAKSILMWKGICNWLGGMGILVLAISILPALGIDCKVLVEAEVPDPVFNKISNRISDSAKNLYLFYIVFTVVEFVLLLASPMNTFDALINTMSSVSTSGMPGMSYAITRYNSFYVEAIIGIFTFLTSVNFTFYYFIIHRNWKTVFSSIELRAFICLILIGSALVSLNLYFTNTYDLLRSFRYGIFQVVSMATTSGFSIIGYADWPAFSLTILVVLMLIGGCSLSTCGAIKVVRVLVMIKLVIRGFYKRIHPRSVVAVKIGSKPVSAQRVSSITIYIMLYLIITLFGAILLSLQNLDFETTLSSSLAMISNIGVGFGDVANGDFSIYCRPLRLVLCFLMIAGRLEIFTLISLFMPSFWNPDKYTNN